MGYALIAAIVFAVAFTVWGAFYVRHELRPDLVKSRVIARNVRSAGGGIGAGDRCRCGGTVTATLDSSGDLLGCTGCDRRWDMDGRKIIGR